MYDAGRRKHKENIRMHAVMHAWIMLWKNIYTSRKQKSQVILSIYRYRELVSIYKYGRSSL